MVSGEITLRASRRAAPEVVALCSSEAEEIAPKSPTDHTASMKKQQRANNFRHVPDAWLALGRILAGANRALDLQQLQRYIHPPR